MSTQPAQAPRALSSGETALREFRGIARVFMRNRPAVVGLFIVVGLAIVAAAAPLIAPADPLEISFNRETLNNPPSMDAVFGTDSLGRDILSRVLYGARQMWIIVLSATGVAAGLGITAGLIAGYVGGRLDELIIMRFVDIIAAMPGLVLILAIVAVAGREPWIIAVSIGFIWSPGYARITRGVVLSIKNDVYVEAARALGASSWRVMWRHMLPNVIPPNVVLASLSAAGIILVEAGLSFLGAGTPPPTPTWGRMVTDAYADIWEQHFHQFVGPAAAIVLTVISFNFLGDGLRDAFDPRLRNVR